MPQLKRKTLAWLLALVACLAPSLVTAQPAVLEADSGQQVQGSGGKTIAVVALSGYRALLDDVNYLGGLMGSPGQADMVEMMVNMSTQGQGIPGLDKMKPWGVVVEANGMNMTQVVCIPTSDLAGILDLVKQFQVTSADAGDGVTELSMPQSPRPMFVKQVDDWVFAASAAEMLDNPPADPTSMMQELLTEYDLGIRLMGQNVPGMYKQMAIGGLTQGVEDGLVPKPDETDEQFEARKQVALAQVEQLKRVIEDIDELTLGLAIDESNRRLVVDASMTALPGSETALESAANMNPTTNFAGFAKEDAAMLMRISADTPEETREQQAAQLRTQMEPMRKQMLEQIDNEEELADNEEARAVIKEAVGDLFDAMMETAIEGTFDMAMSAVVDESNQYVVGAAQVASPEKIESALKKLEQLAEDEPNVPEVQWDAATHGDATFHKVVIPVPDEVKQKRPQLGDTVTLAVGIAPNAVYMGLGPDVMSQVTAAMDASASNLGAATPLAEVVISLNKLLTAGGNDADPMQDMLKDALKGSEDSDQIRLKAEGIENGGRYRIEVEEGVVKALGTVGKAAAQKAAAQQQGGGF